MTNADPSRRDVAFDSDYEPDPIFTTSLYEAKWILGMWLSCFAWTLIVCLSKGYPDTVDPETFPLVFGMPAWVAWGIAFPWLMANIATIIFSLGFMKDGDLGEEPDAHAAAKQEVNHA